MAKNSGAALADAAQSLQDDITAALAAANITTPVTFKTNTTAQYYGVVHSFIVRITNVTE